MALIFTDSTTCILCNCVIKAGDEIAALPPLSDNTHPLYEYFDCGFHQDCFDAWNKKDEALALAAAEKKDFENSDYYQEMIKKYGPPQKPQ